MEENTKKYTLIYSIKTSFTSRHRLSRVCNLYGTDINNKQTQKRSIILYNMNHVQNRCQTEKTLCTALCALDYIAVLFLVDTISNSIHTKHANMYA